MKTWVNWYLIFSLLVKIKDDHLNESYWAALYCGTAYYTVQEVLTFKFMDDTEMNATGQYCSRLTLLNLKSWNIYQMCTRTNKRTAVLHKPK